MKLNICHLYADLMNTYGDDGNITTLIKRCQWRGIDTDVEQISVGNKIDPKKYDLYFFGGGQDQQQVKVADDLKKYNKEALKEAASEKAVILAICGGYQLIGKYYQPFDGKKLEGIGLLDLYTIASNKRMIGNIVIEVDPKIHNSSFIIHNSNHLVGFENHSGQTFLGSDIKPLGKTIVGFGNNGQDKTEGAVKGRVFGCYMHGSLLPKNPHFTDYLIEKSLLRRYGIVKLNKLDDAIEWQAHQSAIKRARQTK